MKTIVVANQKGGVGKTTTAVNLSAYLAYFMKDTLLIDLDPQGNTTSGLGIDKNSVKLSIYDTLVNDTPLSEVILQTKVEWLDLIPANANLVGAEVELVNLIARESRLKKKLAQLPKLYKYIIIDCPPSLGLLTLNGFTAADTILIPIQCEYYAMEGLGQLVNTISLIQQNVNQNLEVEGVVLTMYDNRTNLSGQVIEEVRKYFQHKVYKTVIPRSVRLAEAPSYGQPILLYAPSSRGAEAYENLAREMLGINHEITRDKHQN